jgi:hypothetical protein
MAGTTTKPASTYLQGAMEQHPVTDGCFGSFHGAKLLLLGPAQMWIFCFSR